MSELVDVEIVIQAVDEDAYQEELAQMLHSHGIDYRSVFVGSRTEFTDVIVIEGVAAEHRETVIALIDRDRIVLDDDFDGDLHEPTVWDNSGGLGMMEEGSSNDGLVSGVQPSARFTFPASSDLIHPHLIDHSDAGPKFSFN